MLAQKAAVEEHLRYYARVIPIRDPSYGNFKRSVIIPRLHRALQKIQEGTYGVCDRCEENIDTNRIKLIPGALMCVDCQQTTEK